MKINVADLLLFISNGKSSTALFKISLIHFENKLGGNNCSC